MPFAATESPNPACATQRPGGGFDPLNARKDFPILAPASAKGKPGLVYLDNGATTQKPRQVIEALAHYYQHQNANIHRGVYQLSQEATAAYEGAREKVAQFINAAEPAECIFTRGTTEGINLVASSWGRTFLKPGDAVIVSEMEHHSNIVPWQIICEATGAALRVIPINDAGELDLGEYAKLLERGAKFVSITHLSNSLGTINDVKSIIALAHQAGAKVLVDGAQWVGHHPTDVRAIDADFYAFSGHKLFGPTGIGVLYGRRELLDKMPPYQGGGDMIESVTFAKTKYAGLPNKFEAGTPHIAGAVGLGAAIDYVNAIGFDAFMPHEENLLRYATAQLSEIPGLRIVGTAKHKGSLISFVLENPPASSMDIGMALDADGVAVRTGHHCCQPVMDRFRIAATARASFAFYNTTADIDALLASIKKFRDKQTTPRPAAAAAARSPQQPDDLRFPAPTASSPQAAADELAEMFDLLGEREARNEFVLELGEKLPHTFDVLKTLTQRVPGCMSEVYILGRPKTGAPGVLEFVADANADIVRGLIAILTKLFSGQRAKDVLAFDTEAFFHRIGLEQFITTQRRNGLAGMVQRIRSIASHITSPTP